MPFKYRKQCESGTKGGQAKKAGSEEAVGRAAIISAGSQSPQTQSLRVVQ